MHFLSYGDGHAGGVCSFTDYLQANEDGAWVGLERYPHPTDSQYSWVYRLAEVYSARAKSFCRHGASIESILQEVQESINMYEFDECYFFIGLPSWKRRLYHLYGDWGSAKNHRWSRFYLRYGIDCNMDETDFDKEFGRQLITEMLRTNGVRPKDTTFKSWYDERFASMLTLKKLNLGKEYDPMSSYHPDDDRFKDVIDKWLDLMEKEYLEECKRVNSLTETGHKNEHFIPELLKSLDLIKDSKHNFFFYFTDITWPFPKNGSKYSLSGKSWSETVEDIEEVRLRLDYPNIYWFWGVCMKRFFEKSLDNATPRKLGYYKHEDHYQFSRYMRRNIVESKLI